MADLGDGSCLFPVVVADWKNQTLTPNPEVINVKPFFHTRGGYAPSKGFFLWFRSYTPTAAFFDKSWSLPDVEQVK